MTEQLIKTKISITVEDKTIEFDAVNVNFDFDLLNSIESVPAEIVAKRPNPEISFEVKLTKEQFLLLIAEKFKKKDVSKN